jgi:hypothetical protein
LSLQVASFHAWTVCSSRSATRRAGICGLKPRQCMSRVAPDTLQETFRPISVATRAAVSGRCRGLSPAVFSPGSR